MHNQFVYPTESDISNIRQMVTNCKIPRFLARWRDHCRQQPLGGPAQTEPDWEGEPGDDQQDGKLAEVRVSCKGLKQVVFGSYPHFWFLHIHSIDVHLQ